MLDRPTMTIVGGVGVGLVIALISVWLLLQAESKWQTAPPATGKAVAEPRMEPPPVEEITDSAINKSGQVEPTAEIVAVPDTQVEAPADEETGPRDLSSTQIVAFAAQGLQEALDGDLVTARRVTDLLRVCASSIPQDERLLEDRVQELNQWVANGAAAGDPIPPEGTVLERAWFGAETLEIRLFPAEAQNRAHLTEWYRGCAELDGFFNDEMRSELEALADHGHVTARYLYAMWQPRAYPVGDVAQRNIEWQSTALEFSEANLEAGEVAGLLAFGLSYQQAIFTGRNPGLSIAFLRAAAACGGELAELQDWVANVFTPEHSIRYVERESGLSMAEVLMLEEELIASCQ